MPSSGPKAEPFYETERGKKLAELKAKMGWAHNRHYVGDFVWRGDHWEYRERRPAPEE